MDVRVKTFTTQAEQRLAFLSNELGFFGPEVHSPGQQYPVCMSLRYYHGSTMVDVTLVLAYGGEEYVETTLIVNRHTEHERVTQVGVNTARTGYQMRHALDQQAAALHRTLRSGP